MVGITSYWSFQNVFALNLAAFLTFIYRVNRGTNACNLCVIIKLKTYLIFISGVVVHSVCHY